MRRELALVLGFAALAAHSAASLALPITIGGTEYTRSGYSEHLTASFATPDAAWTSFLYSGMVEVHVAGSGQAYGTAFNDAFYLFTNGVCCADSRLLPYGPPDESNHPSHYQLALDREPIQGESFNATPPEQLAKSQDIVYDIRAGMEVTVSMYVPEYQQDHDYHLVFDVGDLAQLHFGVADGKYSDNSGEYQISVHQLARVPEPATVSLMVLGLVGVGLGNRRKRRARLA